MVSKLHDQRRRSRGPVHQAGPRGGGGPAWEQEPGPGAGTARQDSPRPRGLLKAALGNGEKIFHPADSIIRVTHTK